MDRGTMARSNNYFAVLGQAALPVDGFNVSDAGSSSSHGTSPELEGSDRVSGEEEEEASDEDSDDESDTQSYEGSDEGSDGDSVQGSGFWLLRDGQTIEEFNLGFEREQQRRVRELEQLQAAPDYMRGSVDYCRVQIEILDVEADNIFLFKYITLEGIDRVGLFIREDYIHVMDILHRQMDLLQHAIDHGNGALIEFPPETPIFSTTANVAPASQTWQNRITMLQTYRQRLAHDGSLPLARPSATLILNAEERVHMDQILQRTIATTEWWFTHDESNAQTPELAQWDRDDAAITDSPWRHHPPVGGDYWQGILENIFANGPGVPRARRIPHLPASVAQETIQLEEADLVEDDDACGICQEEYKVGEERSTLPCGHRFHGKFLERHKAHCVRTCPSPPRLIL
ncbi:unnamed protein product [Zymoseptoria tritici ST99CH_1A5]|uniref:RING-type domain-containing protein n=3 Tax=Zymoseptoria tritici TaxID=1047171 RepID=A0A1X7S9J2_ZYMT9|nr:unnamed protein product [Zymoseptoria tritici ST99CH_3D7]SMR62173.1 unnamed protein product [Zymoseptoria tritici ST99CH_1E4]SMR64668.1 unnamed protein product [Zymoseptoria tritici ST99CH_3D1]SMY29998.1 unnamed protein product [Zymoseptoria tritici ST99CH_1A5]